MRNDTTTHITEHDNRISDADDVHAVRQCLCRDRGPETVAEKDPKNKHSRTADKRTYYLLQNNLIDLQADIDLYPIDQIGL